jgi:hypothetical protein
MGTKQTPVGFRITGGKGFHITFPNRWTVSVQFGWGNYCEHHDCEAYPEKCLLGEKPQCGANGSVNAEVAAWGPGGELINMGDDTVRGWQTPAAILALLNAAANGDLAGGRVPGGKVPSKRSALDNAPALD